MTQFDGVQFTQVGEYSRDEYGEVVTTVWHLTLLEPTTSSFDKIRKVVENTFIPEYCTHSYDCCGRMYRHSPPQVNKIEYTDGTQAIVLDTRYRNV